MKKIALIITATAAIGTLCSCTLIRPRQVPVQQGNIITQDAVNQLKPGMSKHQVIAILGSPVLINTFDNNRFDYIYTMQEKYQPRVMQKLLLTFKEDKLTNINGDFFPQTPSVKNTMAEDNLKDAEQTSAETIQPQSINSDQETTQPRAATESNQQDHSLTQGNDNQTDIQSNVQNNNADDNNQNQPIIQTPPTLPDNNDLTQGGQAQDNQAQVSNQQDNNQVTPSKQSNPLPPIEIDNTQNSTGVSQ